MAGRVALMLAHGIPPRDIVAITFTEAAAAELLERIERFVASLKAGTVPPELKLALPNGLSADQRAAIATTAAALDEITCTTIHGFCQQLIKPYPIEAGIDPGATIIDPAAADLAYQDLMTAWLSARFGRTRGDDGLGRIPPMANLGGEDDFFAELLAIEPDEVVTLIGAAANFLRINAQRALLALSWTPTFSTVFHRESETLPAGMPAAALPSRRQPNVSQISPNSGRCSTTHSALPLPGASSSAYCATSHQIAATAASRALRRGKTKGNGRLPRLKPASAEPAASNSVLQQK